MVRQDIFTFPISIGSYKRFIDEIFRLCDKKPSSYVIFANVHMIVEAYRDSNFNRVVKKADIIAPDGRPLSLFLSYLKKIKQERVCGVDVFPELLRQAARRGKSVYLYGTTDEVLRKISDKATKEYPTLNICGHYSPPFRPLSPEENLEVIQKINGAKPDLIFVALGCPKQEWWMAEHKGKVKGCMLGVGYAFQVYAEIATRSPFWMQNLSLEWAYRLYLEPRRLWKRYLKTNFVFLLLIIKYLIRPRSGSFHTKTAHK